MKEMQTMERRKNLDQHPTPELTYDEVIKAWFVHDRQAYSVEIAPSFIFRLAVLDLVPLWAKSPIYGASLMGLRIDIVDRWWVLCGLADAGKPMALYGSRGGAERDCGIASTVLLSRTLVESESTRDRLPVV